MKSTRGNFQTHEGVNPYRIEIESGVMTMSRIYGIESAFGGSDFYDENGNHVGYSVPGIGGGEDYYWDDGSTGYSVDSIIGNGQDYFGSDSKRAYSVDGLFGGKDIYGDVNGFSVDSLFGGSDIFLDDKPDTSDF